MTSLIKDSLETATRDSPLFLWA